MMTHGSPDDRLSRSHPLVSTIRKLSGDPEERRLTGLIIAEGTRLAREALDSGLPIHQAVVSPRLERDPPGRELLARIESARIPLRRADDRLLESLHDAKTQQGVLMLVARAQVPYQELIALTGPLLLLVACGVQDPGNVGALVRLADASGANGLVCAGGADPFGPRAVRGSAGSIFRVPVARMTDDAALTNLLASMHEAGLKVAGAVPRGGLSHRDAIWPERVALCLGGEGDGLPALVESALDLRLTIPMSPRVESINVAAAAAVLLFEAAARRLL